MLNADGDNGLPERLSFVDAAERILQNTGEEPVHYRSITTQALEAGFIVTQGLTPEATMYSAIYNENATRRSRGDEPRFLIERGRISLTAWNQDGLPHQIAEHNRRARERLLQSLKEMPPADFEGLIGTLLPEIGFEDVEVTQTRGDGGIDVRGTLVVSDAIRTTMAIQVKRWNHNVQAPTVQQVRGALGTHEQGLIITTSGFGAGARSEAARANAVPVALMDGDQLVKTLVENDIGVNKVRYDLLEPAPFVMPGDDAEAQ